MHSTQKQGEINYYDIYARTQNERTVLFTSHPAWLGRCGPGDGIESAGANIRRVLRRSLCLWDHLVGQVVKASASRAEDLGFDACLRRGDFPGSSQT